MINTLSRPAARPQAGWLEDEEERDNNLGPQRDETDNRLLPLVAEDAEDRPPLPQREPGKSLEDCQADPEYFCDRCAGWHSSACTAAVNQGLGQMLARMAAETDSRVPHGRQARRTLQDMAPGYTRQPILRLIRPLAMTATRSAA